MHNACMQYAVCTMHALKLHCATLCRVSGQKTGETLDALEMLDSNGCIRLHPPLLVEPLLWWLVRLSLRNTWSGSPGFSSTHIAPHRTTSHHRTTLLVLYSFKTNTPIVSPMWLWDDTTKCPPPPLDISHFVWVSISKSDNHVCSVRHHVLVSCGRQRENVYTEYHMYDQTARVFLMCF